MPYTSYQLKDSIERAQARAEIGLHFRAMLSDAGLSVSQAAKLFQVTARTVKNWRSGVTRAPGVVVHLLRIRSRWQVPCEGWEEWRFHSGKLWTPEGHGIAPEDGRWWAQLVRQARAFRSSQQHVTELLDALRRSGGALAAPGRAAPGLVSVSTTHTGTGESQSKAQQDQRLTMTSQVGAIRYHFDYGMISCPTLFDFPRSLMPRLASVVRAWGSASMPLSLWRWTPISGRSGVAEVSGGVVVSRRTVGARSVVTELQAQSQVKPSKGKARTTGETGVSSIAIRMDGLCSIRNGGIGGMPSAMTIAPPLQRCTTNTGGHMSTPAVVSRQPVRNSVVRRIEQSGE